MYYMTNVTAESLAASARQMLSVHDGIVITEMRRVHTNQPTGKFQIQALKEKPDQRIPKYTVDTIHPPTKYPAWPNQYSVKRTDQQRTTSVARFTKKEDADEYAKLRNERAPTEVVNRYKIEKRGAWLCVIDTEQPSSKYAIAKFASSHEVTAAAFLQRMNQG